jgi:isoquinoline 1-oxidoreductase beta subunit
MNAKIQQPSRRLLLKLGLAAVGGLVLGVELPSVARGATSQSGGAAGFTLNAFVHIDTDGTIALVSPHTEFGQGIYTSSAMLMAEELEVCRISSDRTHPIS